MSTWTLDSLDLGYVQTEGIDLESNLLTMPIPQTPPYATYYFDLQGGQMTLNLSGVKVLTGASAAQTFIYKGSGGSGTITAPATDSLMGKVPGNQNNTITYASDLLGNVSCKVLSINYQFQQGEAYLICHYNISLGITTQSA